MAKKTKRVSVDLVEREQQLALMKLRRQVNEGDLPQEQKQIVNRLVKQSKKDISDEGKIRRTEQQIRKEKLKKEQQIRKEKLKNIGSTTQRFHDTGQKAFKSASQAYGYRTKLSNTLLSFGSGFSKNNQTSQSGPGRPKLVYKNISPFTGKPIPAPQYYKEMRLFRKLQNQKAIQVEQAKQIQYARQGVPPERIQQVQQIQQMQRPQPVQIQQSTNQQNNLPNGVVIPRGTPVWKWRRGVVGEEGGLFGRQKKVYGLPESFWN